MIKLIASDIDGTLLQNGETEISPRFFREAVYLMNGKVIFLLGLTAGLFSIAGNYLGAKCFDKGGAKFVKPLMLVVLVIFFVKTLSEIMAG